MSDAQQLPTLLSEAEAYKKYRQFLKDKELRHARRDGVLGYYVRRGKIFYREDELLAYIQATLDRSYHPPCQEATNSGSAPTSSTELPDRQSGMPAGMTPELLKSAATLLRQQISKNQK